MKLQWLTAENDNECSRSLFAENPCKIYVNVEKVQRFSRCSKCDFTHCHKQIKEYKRNTVCRICEDVSKHASRLVCLTV